MLVYTFDSLGSYFTFLGYGTDHRTGRACEYCMYCKHYYRRVRLRRARLCRPLDPTSLHGRWAWGLPLGPPLTLTEHDLSIGLELFSISAQCKGCRTTARSRSSSLGPSSPAPFHNLSESTGLVHAAAIARGLL